MTGEAHNSFDHRVLAPHEVGELARGEYIGATTHPDYGLQFRWGVYRYATEPMDYYDTAFQALDPAPTDTLLDVGCSDGVNLIRKRLVGSHVGKLIGVDIDPAIFTLGQEISRSMGRTVLEPIDFVAAKGENLPIQANAIDGATALFMLYHSPTPEGVLSELQRVLKPGGKLVVSTSGPENKAKHRHFERIVARYLGAQAPPIFTRHFDTTIAERVLPDYFSVDEPIVQQCEMRIPGALDGQPSDINTYIKSLDSMRPHFRPVPSYEAWQRAIQHLVLPEIEASMDGNNYFVDYIDRKLYVCTNTVS